MHRRGRSQRAAGAGSAYFRPRATLWISSRTSRSTIAGRFSSSHALTIGRSMSRTMLVGELGAANLEIGRQGPEGQSDRLPRLGRQQRLLVASGRFGGGLRFDGLRPAPDDRRRVRVRALGRARGVAVRRGSVLGIDDLRRGRRSRAAAWAPLPWRGRRAMMLRIEARISSIEGSWARCARSIASRSRPLEFELIALIRPPCSNQGPCPMRLCEKRQLNRRWRRPSNQTATSCTIIACDRLPQARRAQRTLLSARRPEADPLVLHLIEMHPRIVLGDRKSEGRDVEPADRRQQLIGIDDLVVFGLNQRRSRLTIKPAGR